MLERVERWLGLQLQLQLQPGPRGAPHAPAAQWPASRLPREGAMRREPRDRAEPPETRPLVFEGEDPGA